VNFSIDWSSQMSTVSVDEQLYQRTSELAKTQGKSVDEFVADALLRIVAQTSPMTSSPRRTTRNGLPVMLVNGNVPRIDPNQVRKLIEEEGF
jgi:hypothetical protein